GPVRSQAPDPTPFLDAPAVHLPRLAPDPPLPHVAAWEAPPVQDVARDFPEGARVVPWGGVHVRDHAAARGCLGGGGGGGEGDSDLVALKIGLLGDQQIGKTSFVVNFVGDEKEEINCSEMKGLNLMDKTLLVNGARISYSIWEVEGDGRPDDHVPVACKDCVAILFMFDLTSRCTLNSVISWYQQARRWNQTAIPIIVGTKFDDFIQLPIDLQWTIASQARAYAKALNATLFFSSATYNINVNKIFKFITAKIFDLPWTVERNLTIGEPIIDF
ncbi:uncharacterized protein J3R85_017018, partial [Psidium guajava]